jgi:hypothetical protein
MNTYDFVHLALYAMGGKIRGKTKLQKTIYFLGRLSNHIDELGYNPHFYGPYSSEVAEAANRLRSIGFLEQSVASGGAFDSRGFEVARWDFALDEEGRKVAELKARKNRDVWRKIEKASAVLKEAGDMDYQRLSIGAKTDFLLGQKGGRAKIKDLEKLASRFGWTVKKPEIVESAKFLEKIGLVKVV